MTILSFTWYQVEQHRGASGAEERSAGLNVTPAELPAGVCWDQVPDPGQEESHRRHSVHGQRPGRSPGSAETPLHNGGSPIRPGAQTTTSTGKELLVIHWPYKCNIKKKKCVKIMCRKINKQKEFSFPSLVNVNLLFFLTIFLFTVSIYVFLFILNK